MVEWLASHLTFPAHPARLPATPPREAFSGPPRTTPRKALSGTTGQGSPASRQKAPGLLPGRFYQKTILLMKGVWWAYGMKAREGSGSVIIREARFPGVIEPRVSSTPMA